MHVVGLREEAGVPKESSGKHKENHANSTEKLQVKVNEIQGV